VCKDCEQLTLETGVWKELPRMKGERGEFKGFVYLCGFGSVLMEAFDPQSANFLLLKTRLSNTSIACCLYVDKDHLVVLCDDSTVIYSQGQGHQLHEVSKVQHGHSVVTCNMPPLVELPSGCVYIAEKGVCYCIRLDGVESREVAKLS